MRITSLVPVVTRHPCGQQFGHSPRSEEAKSYRCWFRRSTANWRFTKKITGVAWVDRLTGALNWNRVWRFTSFRRFAGELAASLPVSFVVLNAFSARWHRPVGATHLLVLSSNWCHPSFGTRSRFGLFDQQPDNAVQLNETVAYVVRNAAAACDGGVFLVVWERRRFVGSIATWCLRSARKRRVSFFVGAWVILGLLGCFGRFVRCVIKRFRPRSDLPYRRFRDYRCVS